MTGLYESLAQGQHQVRDEQGQREAAIILRGVRKRFVLQKSKPFLLSEAMRRLSGFRRRREEFWALQGLDLTIRRGESVGIIGRNGAGKSTLLGVMAGCVFPTSGDVEIHGRIGALLELGAGFHPDLTGRENIYLNASLLGMTEDEIDGQFRSIVEFSEMDEFIDVPLRNYSSGMHVRLGFSVAIHINPDILIMDEALAVGDLAFQRKCTARIAEFKAQGKTMILVSHGTEQVAGLCERAVWLHQGRIEADGPARDVLARYAESRQARATQG